MPEDYDVVVETVLSLAQSSIQRAMREAGISQSELARRMGVHRAHVSRMMSSRSNMTIRTYGLAIAACGQMPILELRQVRHGR